ncbi:hypothetical protein BDL97_06G128300 [Sphagnum fallax]|nr:hypothetical protein BDL97_06G128300 [Sphagnum fallax]
MTKLRPQFVLFGDSITQLSFENGGWGAALAALYSRQLSSPPDVVTVFFGANDAALPVPDGEHFHVPLPQYKANLHQIVSHIKSNSETTVVVLITPPPLDDEAWIEFRSDGLHLSVGGNRIVFNELVNVLNDILFLRADKLPMDFPPFGDIDPKNPGVAFQSWENNSNLGS